MLDNSCSQQEQLFQPFLHPVLCLVMQTLHTRVRPDVFYACSCPKHCNTLQRWQSDFGELCASPEQPGNDHAHFQGRPKVQSSVLKRCTQHRLYLAACNCKWTRMGRFLGQQEMCLAACTSREQCRSSGMPCGDPSRACRRRAAPLICNASPRHCLKRLLSQSHGNWQGNRRHSLAPKFPLVSAATKTKVGQAWQESGEECCVHNSQHLQRRHSSVLQLMCSAVPVEDTLHSVASVQSCVQCPTQALLNT